MVYFCLFVFIENFILECYCSVDKKAEIYYSAVSYIKAVRKPESIEKLEQDTSNVTMGFPPEVYLNKDFF